METAIHQQQPETRESVPATDNDIHATLDLHTTEQITRFDDEVPIQHAKVVDQPQIPESIDPFPHQSIIAFLSRPRVVHSFKWTAGTAAGKCLARLSFPDSLFESPTVWNKVQQFVYLRSGLHFTVRVNGTPFHYGQLLAVWRPACLQRNMYPSNATTSGIYDNIYAVSQYPHMLVSPSSAQVVELTVPYESPLERIPIRAFTLAYNNNALRLFSNMGVLEFWVLNALRGQGSANAEPPVTVSCFANFVNPELTGYTHAQLTFLSEELGFPPAPPTPTAMRYRAQITQAGEEPMASTNPSQLPIAFISANTSSTQNNNPTYQLALTEHSTSIIKKTKIKDHLTIWSLLSQYNVATTSNLNAVLATFYVHPSNCPIATLNRLQVRFNTKLSYIAELFSLWRGPIEYRFDFIASKFHSCRIKIAWYPPNTLELARNEELPDAWTQIVDVQGMISTNFTVPYLQSNPWLTLNEPNSNRSTNGIIVLTLLNSLSYPLANGPPIGINCWIRAPNIEFAAFTNQNAIADCYFPSSGETDIPETPFFSNTAPPNPPNKIEKPAVVAKIQSEKLKQQITQAEESTITPVDLECLPYKPTFFGYLTAGGKIWITPPMSEPIPPRSLPDNSIRGMKMSTLLNYLSFLHLGYTGSVRISVLNPQTEILSVPRLGFIASLDHTYKSSTPMLNRLANERYTASSYYPSSANSVKDITLPNYSSLVYRPILADVYTSHSTSSSICLPGIDIYNLSTNPSLVTLAAATDFQFVGMTPAPMTFERMI